MLQAIEVYLSINVLYSVFVVCLYLSASAACLKAKKASFNDWLTELEGSFKTKP